MPQINLLPWREELRKRRQKEFGVWLAAMVVLTIIGIALVHVQIQDRITFQNERNQFLEQQIKALDKKIVEIRNLEGEKRRLLARMRIIEQLQTSRPEIVHIFDAFVRTLPDGVYYTRIEQRGKNFTLQGVAQSNARVSSLMRNLEASKWLEKPKLIEIKARSRMTPGDTLRLSDFTMTVSQKVVKKKQGDEG